MSTPRRLSVIIPNYNYGQYIQDAIDTALSLQAPDVEVIVVDDGSTDDSRERIARYGARITAVFQENSGQLQACNAGFAVSTGDAVMFLDSDDVLYPQLFDEISRLWRPGLSKVQFPMLRIDASGVATGTSFPKLSPAPSSEMIRKWAHSTGAYPTPPGSGNVYSRAFLTQIFPLSERCGRFSDSACLAAAPFLGDVVSSEQPLVGYRLHGNNDSNLLADPARFTTQLTAAYQRHRYAMEIGGCVPGEFSSLFRGRHLLQLRVAGYRLRPHDHPIPEDSRLRMLADTFIAPFAPGPESVGYRLAASAWSIAALLAPMPLAKRLISRRFRQPDTG